MWGFKGGRKEGREYPTVKSIMEKFYSIHEGTEDADITVGEIPKVGYGRFRYVIQAEIFYKFYKFKYVQNQYICPRATPLPYCTRELDGF